MRVHRPDGAGAERVVIEDAQQADVHVLRVVVPVEAEVPACVEPAAVGPCRLSALRRTVSGARAPRRRLFAVISAERLR